MAGSYLLIDHDRFGIKSILMEEIRGKITIQSRCEIFFKDLPEPSEISDSHDMDLFGAAMEHVSDSMDISSCSAAVILISQEAVYFRTINFPFHSEKKIQQVLPFELEPILPTSNEPFISDFHVLDQTGDMTMTLTASIAESRIKAYFLILGRFGIRPRIITPAGSAGAFAFLRGNPHLSDFAFLHIAKYLISLTLVHNRKLWTIRMLPGSFRSADALSACLHQTIAGFRQKTGGKIEFNPIIAFDQDLPGREDCLNSLQKKLGQSIQVIDGKSLLISEPLDDADDCRINFCKGKYRATPFLKTHFNFIAAGIVLFFCTLGLWVVATSLDNSELNRKIRLLDEKALLIFTETFPDQKRVQDPYLQMKAGVKELKKTNADPDKNQPIGRTVKVMDVLSELSSKTDPAMDVEISSFLLNSGRLVLSGSTDNFNTVDKVKTGLESSDLFKKVGISSAAADKKGDRVNFKFNIDL